MIYEEDDYLHGLVAYIDLPREEWLMQYFELFKSTLVWPPGLPPIKRPCMVEGTLKLRFHNTFQAALNEYDYKTDNHNQTLSLRWLWSDHPAIGKS